MNESKRKKKTGSKNERHGLYGSMSSDMKDNENKKISSDH